MQRLLKSRLCTEIVTDLKKKKKKTLLIIAPGGKNTSRLVQKVQMKLQLCNDRHDTRRCGAAGMFSKIDAELQSLCLLPINTNWMLEINQRDGLATFYSLLCPLMIERRVGETADCGARQASRFYLL